MSAHPLEPLPEVPAHLPADLRERLARLRSALERRRLQHAQAQRRLRGLLPLHFSHPQDDDE